MSYFGRANLQKANLSGACFKDADLSAADLKSANLKNSYLCDSKLEGANLSGANIRGANLTRANLEQAIMVRTQIQDTILSECNVFGISVWELEGVPAKQENLFITPKYKPAISVDNLEVAQFIYLLLKNEKLKNVIDTITSRVVLILGRFSDERKAVLDAIRQELRKLNFTPILCDFDKPLSKDITGTVDTLARMARFIVADLTDPSSIPHELATIIPSLRTTPVLPIRQKGAAGYTMFEDFQRDLPHRVLDTFEYEDILTLIAALPAVISPANAVAENFRKKVESF